MLQRDFLEPGESLRYPCLTTCTRLREFLQLLLENGKLKLPVRKHLQSIVFQIVSINDVFYEVPNHVRIHRLGLYRRMLIIHFVPPLVLKSLRAPSPTRRIGTSPSCNVNPDFPMLTAATSKLGV